MNTLSGLILATGSVTKKNKRKLHLIFQPCRNHIKI